MPTKSPNKTLEGLVSNSVGGRMAADQSHILVVLLQPWRGLDGVVVTDAELRVELPVGPKEALYRWMDKLKKGDGVVVAATGVAPPPKGLKWFVAQGVTELKKTTRDLKLAEERARLEVPVVIADEELGKLTYDRELDSFVGKRKAGGKAYELSVEHTSARPPAQTGAAELAAARKQVTRIEARLSSLIAAVTKAMLPGYNDTWRGQRRALDAAGFARRLKLATVAIGPKRTTVYFADGGLFLDHVIEVRLDAKTGAIKEICLAG